MSETYILPGFSSESARNARLNGRRTCLFVGETHCLQRAVQHTPISLPVEVCQIFDLLPLLIGQPHPDIVLSFAITPLFDCLDLAKLLFMNGFTNRQRIVNLDLPNPELVCREVRAACPTIDFGVLDASELGHH